MEFDRVKLDLMESNLVKSDRVRWNRVGSVFTRSRLTLNGQPVAGDLWCVRMFRN